MGARGRLSKILLSTALSTVICACGDSEKQPAIDMSFVPGTDLSIGHLLDGGEVDLAATTGPPYDLAWSMCAGSKLAGTCAEKFFEPFVSCFQPTGPCLESPAMSGNQYCWEGGGKYREPDPLATWSTWTYDGGRDGCLVVNYVQSSFQFCLPTDPSCGVTYDLDAFVASPHGGARYDPNSGIFTCPDGTQVDVGPATFGGSVAVGDCTVLNELLNPKPLCNPFMFGSCSGS